MMNKRGQTKWVVLAVVGLMLVGLGIGIYFVVTSDAFKSYASDVVGDNPAENVMGFEDAFSDLAGAKYLNYIFGPIPSFLGDIVGGGVVGAGIVVIAIWMFIFITFSDIIAQFSTFKKWTSWGIGFLVAIIAANLKLLVVWMAFMIGAFAFLGGLAVIAGLGAAFAVFLIVNLGLASPSSPFKKWLEHRGYMAKYGKGASEAAEGFRAAAEIAAAAGGSP